MLALLEPTTWRLDVLALPDVLQSSRGLTGLALSERFLFAAAPLVKDAESGGSPERSSLFVFDRTDLALRTRYVFEHGVDVHSIFVEGDRLWAISTGTDEVLELALDGAAVRSESVAWRPDPEAPREDRHHLNGISRVAGRLLVAGFGPRSGDGRSWGTEGFVQDIEAGLRIGPPIDQPHSVAEADGQPILCESRAMAVRSLEGRQSSSLGGYTRGLCSLEDGLLVGISTGRVVSNGAGVVNNPSDPGAAAGECSIARLSRDRWDVEEVVDATELGREIYALLPVDGVSDWPIVAGDEWRRDTLRALWRRADLTLARAKAAEQLSAERMVSLETARQEADAARGQAAAAWRSVEVARREREEARQDAEVARREREDARERAEQARRERASALARADTEDETLATVAEPGAQSATELTRLADRVDVLSRSLGRWEVEVSEQASAGIGRAPGSPSPRGRLRATRQIARWLRRPTPARLRLVKAYFAISRSGAFDRRFYLSSYPYVQTSGADPLGHYIERGWRQGLDPNPDFSSDAYLRARPDVARKGVNPLLHALRYDRGSLVPEEPSRDGPPAAAVDGLERPTEAPSLPAEDLEERTALEAERASAADFARRYAATVPAPLDTGGPETASAVVPVDRRDVLAAAGDGPQGEPSVDVVVCVRDALADLRRCVLSLLAKTGRAFHLILVDDGSGPETRAFLRRLADANAAVTLVTREGPEHGYTLAANAGVRASTGDYVVLLNSDTVVTFGWLERLIECGESDPLLGIVGPLSNAASHQSIPNLREAGAWAVNEVPSFLTADGLAFLLGRLSPRDFPRFPFLNGFCYAVKREVIDAVGLFDEERFASGYCEENDFSYRADQAGFALGVADAAYVFHAKSRSYGQQGRKEIARRNYGIFLDKHGEANVKARVAELERSTALNPLRELVADATADPASFVRAFRSACPEPLRVGFVLHGVGRAAAGGVHSIYQEACGMRTLGIDSCVLVPTEGLDNARRLYRDADDVFACFASEHELARLSEDRDVVVATHFGSSAMVRKLKEQRDDFLPAYYIQDYEPFFFAEGSGEAGEARASYDALPDGLLFAKTQWLCALVGRTHDRHVAKVEPSIDHDVYRPGDRRRRGRRPLRVLAMVRPRTRRRQPLGTLRILDRLEHELGRKVEVRAFGCERSELAPLAPLRSQRVENLGLLTREHVAEALRQTDVFLDFSSYQAFGRTALEAMACGCTAIVPSVGGAVEYAVHGENAYVIDTTSEEPAFEAIAALARDRDALQGLRERAVETAGRFSVMRAALSEYVLFAEEHARRRASAPSAGAHSHS